MGHLLNQYNEKEGHNMENNIIRRTGLLVCITLLTACSKYYALTTEYVSADITEAPAEIVTTPAYNKMYVKLKIIAVQAPDKCINETSAEKSGKAERKAAVVTTQCGVEMAEIERGLVRQGYQVLSWKELAQAQKKYSQSPKDAAEKLGAEAIFLINSTERGKVHQGENARWERRFYNSNSDGLRKAPPLVNETRKSQFLRLLRSTEGKLAERKRLSTTVNATVFLVSTGRAIWFYDWTHAEEELKNVKGSRHVFCEEEYCQRAAKHLARQKSSKLSSGDTSAVSTQGRPADVIKAIHTRLMKEVIIDMA